MNKNLLLFIIIAILAAIPFGMGKYFEFNRPGPFDSGAYVYSAKRILDGAKIGVEEVPSAQSGTLLVNMLGVGLYGFNDTGPKLIQAILQAAALLFMFITMRKLFGTLPAGVGVIIASVYLSAPLIAKHGNVKEQYMIAFMIMGISCFVLYELGSKWWWAVLAGGLLFWAPLFKQTGTSALAAVGLFVIAQPLLKQRSWKQTIADIGLLLAGAAAALAPVYIWLFSANAPISYMPYGFVFNMLSQLVQSGGAKAPSYVGASREVFGLVKQFPIVMRFYKILMLPIALAAGSITLRIVNALGKAKYDYDRFVLLFAVWWILDMAFVWVSPRSYVQYYLPLTASAAMLGGYLIAVYNDKLASSIDKNRRRLVGVIGLICVIAMSWHIFFGISKHPSTGKSLGQKQGGYAQRLNKISRRRRDNLRKPWEDVGDYIREHSKPTDKIYVWGWFPGIYVKAQRLSSAPKAFTSEMHVKPPLVLSEMIAGLLRNFEKEIPRFIVDSRKRHFPWDRAPLELWPRTPKGFIPSDENEVSKYDAAYSKLLRERVGPDEALRYEAMKPFRTFVMKNYRVVWMFGPHVLFERN
jgi:hypothetical protein